MPSAATISILKLFGDCKVGDVVTYLSMRHEIKTQITDDELRQRIASAIHTMRNDHGRVFACVPRVGYQLLSAAEVVTASDRDVRRIKRAAKNASQKLLTVNPEVLDDASRGKMTARLVTLAVAEGCFDVQRTRKLEGPRASSGDREAVKQGLREILF